MHKDLPQRTPFATLAEELPVGILIVSRTGAIVEANRAVGDMLGFNCREHIGRSICEWLAREHDAASLLSRVQQQRIVHNEWVPFRCKDRTTRYLRVSASGAFRKRRLLLVFCVVQSPEMVAAVENANRRSESYFESVLNATDHGIYGVDLDGQCLFINETAAQFIGRRVDRLVGQPIHELIECVGVDGALTDPLPSARGFRPAHGCPAEGLVLCRCNGSTIPIEYFSYPIVEGGEITGTVVAFMDVTVRRQAIQTQRRHAAMFRQLARHSREVFWVVERASGRMLYVSPGYEETWGRPADELYSRSDAWFEHVHPEDRERTLGGQRWSDVRNGYDLVYRIRRPDGSIRWIRDRAFPIPDEAGVVHQVAGIAEDITEHKLTMDALQKSLSHSQALSSYMERAREEERSRIGQEVHDNLGGILTYLKLDLTRLAKELMPHGETAVSQPVTRKLEAMVMATDQAIRTVQRVGMELRPVLLEQFGLPAALDWQAKEFERRTGIHCWVQEKLRLNSIGRDQAVLLFRIVQEALTNVARHAEATRVAITLRDKVRNVVVLIVQDNGKGIPSQALQDVKSFGLMGMRERARLAGGALSFSTGRTKGTTVTVEVPAIRCHGESAVLNTTSWAKS